MENNFDKTLNISYVEETLPEPDKYLIMEHCISSCTIYIFVYILLKCNPFFSKYFDENISQIYLICLAVYFVTAPFIYLIFKPKSIYKSHNITICNYFKNLFKKIFNKDTVLKKDYKSILNSFVPSYEEKQAIMLLFIKVFFGTLMVKFLANDFVTISNNIEKIKNIFDFSSLNFDIKVFQSIIVQHADFFYSFIITILFTIDVFCFSIGYLTECAFLKNRIRTVDTNIMGIMFCLICYPPFNSISSSFLGWNQNDNSLPQNSELVYIGWILKIIALMFLSIYACASIALGTKASNLTNRGTVSKFPYNICRHPAYISKCTFWILTTIPLFMVDFSSRYFDLGKYCLNSFLIICSTLFWVGIYYMRAITEEQHLMKDPEYQEYAKKVKWRFIPYII